MDPLITRARHRTLTRCQRRHSPRISHEHVQAAELPHSRLHCSLGSLNILDIDSKDQDLRGGHLFENGGLDALECCLMAGDKNQRSAGEGVVACDVPTNTSRRASDEDDLVLVSLVLEASGWIDGGIDSVMSVGSKFCLQCFIQVLTDYSF